MQIYNVWDSYRIFHTEFIDELIEEILKNIVPTHSQPSTSNISAKEFFPITLKESSVQKVAKSDSKSFQHTVKWKLLKRLTLTEVINERMVT